MFDHSGTEKAVTDGQELDEWLTALRKRDCNKPRRNLYDTAMDVIAAPKADREA